MNEELLFQFKFTRSYKPEQAFKQFIIYKLFDQDNRSLGELLIHGDEAVFKAEHVRESLL